MRRLFIAVLSSCYSPSFRREHGDAMRAALDQRLEEARREGVVAVAGVWAREVRAAGAGFVARFDDWEWSDVFALRGGVVNEVVQVVQAVLVFRREPRFALLVSGIMALGIAATSAVFAVVDGVLIRPLAYSQPDRLTSIWAATSEDARSSVAGGDYLDLAERSRTLSDLSAWQAQGRTLTVGDRVEYVGVTAATTNYFDVLGIQPALGRTFSNNAEGEAVISYDFWQSRFNGDSSVLGQPLGIGHTHQIVGVLPRGVDPNLPEITGERARSEVFIPVDGEWSRTSRAVPHLRIVARLADGMTSDDVSRELARLSIDMSQYENRESGGWHLYSRPVQDDLVEPVKPHLLLLSGAVVIMLVVTAVNASTMFLIRSLRSGREYAVRAAIGAGRGRLFRQAILEACVIAMVASGAALVVARVAVASMQRFAVSTVPRLEDVSLDMRVVLFSMGVALLAAVVSSLPPALKVARSDPRSAMDDGHASISRRDNRFLRGLVLAEVAMALMLTVGAGLMLRSLQQIKQVDPGFEAANLIKFRLFPAGFESVDQALGQMDDVIRGLHEVPGVSSFAFVNRFPLSGGSFGGPYASEQQDMGTAHPDAEYRWVTGEYFEAMGATLLAGRELHDSDGPESVVIDDVLAGELWPDGDAVGQRILTGGLGADGWSTVVGVVGHIRHTDLTRHGTPTVYLHNQLRGLGQYLWGAVRVSGDPAQVARAIPGAVAAALPRAALVELETMDEIVASHLAPRRLALNLIMVFSVLAVVLTAAGVATVASLSVSQRLREFAIRNALGATPLQIATRVMVPELTTGAAGMLGGAGIVLITGRRLGPLLFGTSPADPMVVVPAAALILGVVVLAGIASARRAVRSDPATILRTT